MLGQIVKTKTGEVVFESDDPKEIATKADKLHPHSSPDNPNPFSINGFDMEELNTGVVHKWRLELQEALAQEEPRSPAADDA